MATPSLNTVAIPTSMATRGDYQFQRQRVSQRNAQGDLIVSGPQTLRWLFGHMTPTELAWWTDTLMAGARSLTLTGAELWDDHWIERAFTSGVLYEPQVGSVSGGLHRQVLIEIRHLLPIVVYVAP